NSGYDEDFFQFMFKSHKLIGILLASISWMLFPFLFKTNKTKQFSLKPTIIIFSIALVVTSTAAKATYNCFWITRMYFVVDIALYIFIIAVVIKYTSKIKGLKFIIPIGCVICLAFLYNKF